MSGRGLLVAATSSRSGKTTFTMALARALKTAGHDVRCAKSGPDYIDPAFHAAATGAPCPNLDGWAMSDARLKALASGPGLLIVEGAMGLFDGAAGGKGSSADLAKTLNLPVLLLVDCAAMSQSVAAIVYGFLAHDPALNIAGLILNNVGSARHEALLTDALAGLETPILGIIRRCTNLHRPSRHLGLVQASEDAKLEDFLDTAASNLIDQINLNRIISIASDLPSPGRPARLPPLGTHIAVAQDAAFTFTYPHFLDDWASAGSQVTPFSPLQDQPPHPDADAIYLPGGYPELHAHALTRAGTFRAAMKAAKDAGKTIYGECGGHMVLGHALTDKKDIAHPMLGLLDLETSFATRKLHLGYRNLTASRGVFAGHFKGHEFHYATTLRCEGEPLFEATDATGCTDTQMGLVSGSVSGSFAHIIDRA